MKICDVTQFYSEVSGGVKRYVEQKRRYVENCTGDEHLLVIPGARDEVRREGRLTTWTIASPQVNKTSRYRILLRMGEVDRILQQEKPDIIESGDPYHLGWRAINIGDELEIPVVGFYHSHFPEAYLRTVLKYCGSWIRDAVMAYAQDYICRLYNRFDRTLVPSHYLAELLREWGVGNAVRVRLGVDTSVFNPQADGSWVRPELSIPQDRILLLYIGRLAGEKNTKTLIETFRYLDRTEPGRYAFLVIGDGGLRDLVRDAERQLELFRWIPYCADAKRLAGFYRAADMFVHPGVCETFGLVTMESQACACPVVGIHGSYMDANVFAGLDLWASANTPESLAGAIGRIAAADRKQLGALASAKVLASYSWEQIFSEMWEIYRGAIHEKKTTLRAGGLVPEKGVS
jgi:alpha-1,6-mannosyltransferase